MLRPPRNKVVINWESLSVQGAAEMSLIEDILGREPSKISIVPAPWPTGSLKFGPGCGMAEKKQAHLYVDGISKIEYITDEGEKIRFKLLLCDSQIFTYAYAPATGGKGPEERMADAGRADRQKEMQSKRDKRDSRTVMIVG